MTPAKKTKTESCVQNLRIYYQSVTYIGMDTCPNVLWPPDGCLHSHRYHQRVPETSHDFVCYIPHCIVFWSDWLEGGSIGAEWLNRGRGTVSHSFHLESIFDPDPPQPSGTCNHHPLQTTIKNISTTTTTPTTTVTTTNTWKLSFFYFYYLKTCNTT